MNYNKTTNRKHRQRGMSIAPVMMFALGFTSIGVGVMSLSTTYNRGAKKMADKIQSTALAESGVAVIYDQTRLQMNDSFSFPFNVNSTTVTVPASGNTETIGTYSARMVSDREVQTDIEQDGRKYRKYTYYFTVEGRGQAVGGVVSTVKASFKGEIWKNLVPRVTSISTPAPDQFTFPVGGIVSNEGIDIKTDQGFKAFSLDGLDGAHIIANNGIKWDTVSGGKSGNVTTDLLDIQGFWLVPDGGAYSSTVADTGLGNPNGLKNYKSPSAPADGDFPGADANTVIKMDDNIDFASSSTVDDWKEDWHDQASVPTGTIYGSALSAGSIPPRTSDGKIGIQAPARVDGNLSVANGEKLELWPASSDPKKNVVYVQGNVQNYGQIVNHGVTLVFEGTYKDDSDAEYKIEEDAATFKTKEEAIMRSAFLSLAEQKDAIRFSTNATLTTGLVYALNGGIQIRGTNPVFTGMLLAGGNSGNGGVDIAPAGGSSFVMKYDPYAATGGTLKLDAESVINTDMVPGNLAKWFTPTKLVNWVQTK